MKKTIIYSTILTLVLASAFSCCLLPTAEVEAASVEMSCQHHGDSTAAADETKVGCDCPEMISLNKEMQNLDDFNHLIISQTIVFDLSTDQRSSDRIVILADAGPPSSDIPLYIQHSILRI